jgi:hypothetical protein
MAVRQLMLRFSIIFMIGILVVACPEEQREETIVSRPTMTSRGVITVNLNRYIETTSAVPFEQFGLMGMFARYNLDDMDAVEAFLEDDEIVSDLPLDTCSVPGPILEKSRRRLSRSETAIQLLDVGDLSVSLSKETKPIPTRTFPDLLKMIDGVIYTADDNQGISFQPGVTYDVRASGTKRVAPFRVSLEAPEDLGEIRVDGTLPDEQTPIIGHSEEIELTWEGDGNGDDVVVKLDWVNLGAQWSATCRMRDDGLFVIPDSLTSVLPDPLNCTDEEMTFSRVRQVAFRSNGLASGSLKFIVSTNFPVTF